MLTCQTVPYIGLAALFVVVVASVGQLVVLLVANDKSATAWVDYITPNVFLSILNGIASLAITFAVMQGIAIAWWRRALMGASIKELHYTWNFSTSVMTILLKFKYFNAIALAALMTKLAIVDGVLFQRAINTYISIDFQEPRSGQSSVFAWSQTDFPVTGLLGAHSLVEGQTEYNYSWTVLSWVDIGNGVNYYDSIDYCYAAGCVYGLPGAGFSIDCETTTETINLADAARHPLNGSNTATMFSVDFHMLYPDASKNYARLQMDARWPTPPEYDESGNGPEVAPNVCPNNFTVSKCEFRPAVLNYTVAFTNTTSIERSKLDKVSSNNRKDDTSIGYSGSQLVYSCQSGALAFGRYDNSLGDAYDDTCGVYNSTLKQLKGVEVLRTQDLNETFVPGGYSHLLGIYNALKGTFTTSAILESANGSWSASQTGLLAPIKMGESPPNGSYCNYTYYDPTYDIVQRLNVLMLQTSVSRELYPNVNSTAADGSWTYNQDLPSHQFYKDIYYSTDFRYAGAALGMTVVVILCILPSYWGFWQLGRDVTLGPFEIAYAFQGPAFSSVHGVDGRADEVVKTVGRTRVQYGEVEDETGKRLAFKMTELPPGQAR